MEIASEKRVIAATNLKLEVKYDYSVSGSSYSSFISGGNERIPTCMLPHQNLRITQGQEGRILVEMGLKIKFLLLFLTWNFTFTFQYQILVYVPSRKWKIICPHRFYSNTLNTQYNIIASPSLSFLCYKIGIVRGFFWGSSEFLHVISSEECPVHCNCSS